VHGEAGSFVVKACAVPAQFERLAVVAEIVVGVGRGARR
jgi:hypothetical protein